MGLRTVTRTVVILSPTCHIATDQQAAPQIYQLLLEGSPDNRSRCAQSVSLPVHRVASVALFTSLNAFILSLLLLLLDYRYTVSCTVYC